MADFTLDWRSIRPLNGNRHAGFEELCAQLARCETPPAAKFVRKGTPDAGVECFCQFPDGSEWGWQAKYVFSIDNQSLGQADGSVNKALDSHPNLKRYFLCFPCDRPDARLPRQTSALQKWNRRVTKWKRWAAAKGMDVEFIPWDSSELLERLQKPEHTSRVRFWFDECGFDHAWFHARWEESRATAGNRYTPQLHVGLPIVEEFQRFGRLREEEVRLRNYARELRRHQYVLGLSDREQLGEELTTEGESIAEEVHGLIRLFRGVVLHPSDQIDFSGLFNEIKSLQEKLNAFQSDLRDRKRELNSQRRAPTENYAARYMEPLRNTEVSSINLEVCLGDGIRFLKRAQETANATLLILCGDAGTGKTHLLCDIAKSRIDQKLPTIILMGQKFRRTGDALIQGLEMLDMGHFSAEAFVGALEAAAQSANARALFMIDAINEGDGIRLWDSELPSLLARLHRSPWIGVVLSVRSSYESILVPHHRYPKEHRVVHEGFEGVEYDALKMFFKNYGLELPSTPQLDPEFRNPLFLKTLCEGLKNAGQSQLPRGRQGVSEVFRHYIQGIEARIATKQNHQLALRPVEQALKIVVRAMCAEERPWLSILEAVEVCRKIIPGVGLQAPLFDDMVSEGLLEVDYDQWGHKDEVVRVCYERLLHHLMAEEILEPGGKTGRKGIPLSIFNTFRGAKQAGSEGDILSSGPQSEWLLKSNRFWRDPGLMEALCVMFPEKTGVELPRLEPGGLDALKWGKPFRHSLIWRAPESFTKDTIKVMREMVIDVETQELTLDVLMTLSSLPQHPLNADYLNGRLRACSMPDRDAWWSVYLHHAWGERGPIERIIDWAKVQTPDSRLDDESVRLCSTTLLWMLTTPHRFIRDHATTALVSLLTGRLEILDGLIHKFHDVDDPYLKERLYAVAYGVVSRSHDAVGVGKVASSVFELFFSSGEPYPHMLMRDYARGVVERALGLGAKEGLDPALIRPPYGSAMPAIPTKEELDEIYREAAVGSDGAGKSALDRIDFSVRGDDFCRYVISTNGWYDVPLSSDDSWPPALNPNLGGAGQPPSVAQPEMLPIEKAQNYILKRVLDLGWSPDLHGDFDQNQVGYHGRDARKPERIGKKYQWIAYQEFLGYVSDHYRYWNRPGTEEADVRFDGPWQGFSRDIDPTNTLLKKPIESVDMKKGNWWCRFNVDLSYPVDPIDWARDVSHTRNLDELCSVTKDGDTWLTGYSFISERSETGAGYEYEDVERRDEVIFVLGGLIKDSDAESFLQWAEQKDFYGHDRLNPGRGASCFLGECGWSPAALYHEDSYFGEDGWMDPDYSRIPFPIKTLASIYSREVGGYDCATEDSYELHVPTGGLIRDLDLRWSGKFADFLNAEGEKFMFDPSAHEAGPDTLLINQRLFQDYLDKNGLTVCWIVWGEKRVYPPGLGRAPKGSIPEVQISGAYAWIDGEIRGFSKHFMHMLPADDETELECIDTHTKNYEFQVDDMEDEDENE
ncbi:MAG: hypothetical protein JJU29_07480 [Verrucomicrobia bacterium]|nr:hypothetical protein [Verrucomicrobiota bacterium]MCH8511657.1 hypothetical protein [Kiritimatiellia bacterium]